ncbi:MAG: type I restriction enzyme HsdR N-terminal domain-containing protein [Saprospiraceae bacterium]|nr:type I restriction enzyme HsdR N-terminal domain-containing protein [Saprospiraceae bacterium]
MQVELSDYHSHLQISRRAKERYIFDPVRKAYFLVQPEELVRQSWIQYLHRAKNIALSSLAVEKQFKLFDGTKRFDLLLYQRGNPVMLFEFKSFKTSLTDATCRQAAAYNFHLKVPYIMLSNGIQHRLFFIDMESEEVKEIMDWPENLSAN